MTNDDATLVPYMSTMLVYITLVCSIIYYLLSHVYLLLVLFIKYSESLNLPINTRKTIFLNTWYQEHWGVVSKRWICLKGVKNYWEIPWLNLLLSDRLLRALNPFNLIYFNWRHCQPILRTIDANFVIRCAASNVANWLWMISTWIMPLMEIDSGSPLNLVFPTISTEFFCNF